MIWKRKEKVDFTAKGGSFIIPPTPAKKAFTTMLELLIDSEKYDNEGEMHARDSILTILSEYIEKLKSENHKS